MMPESKIMNGIPLPDGIQTRFFALEHGTLKGVPQILREFFGGRRPWIVADENTFAAAGAETYEICQAAGLDPHEPFLFKGKEHLPPDFELSVMLERNMPDSAVPAAVGSGVINDLVKCAAGLRETPYLCVPTAASVDGYTSSGGAMLVRNYKKTVPGRAPLAIAADLTVLENAPAKMTASGYGDLLTKVVAGADWIVADQLGIEKIAPGIWDLVQKDLRSWIQDSRNLKNIFLGLAATGYAMQLYHDSRPASGAEHLASHIWEMEELTLHGEEVSHGFKVSLGTLGSARLHHFILNTPLKKAKESARKVLTCEERRKEVEALLIRGCYGDEPRKLAMEKTLYGSDAEARREWIWNHWEAMQKRLAVQLLSVEELTGLLRKAGCPMRPEEIGLSREQFIHGFRAAQLIRKRYTVTDLLYEAGLLDSALDTFPV